MSKNFVLVHGAWHGGWCWSETKALLESQGHCVEAPDLPSHGNDSTDVNDVTLANCVDRVVASVENLEGKVVLVGHSLGGFIISAVAERMRARIEELVFVCAMVPKSGESANDCGRSNVASVLRGNLVPAEDGKSVTLKPAFIPMAFYHDCAEEDQREATSKLCPQSTAVFAEPVTLTDENFGAISKHYIECLEDQAVHIVSQREMAAGANCELVTSLNTGHSPFMASPEALVLALISDVPED